MILIVIDESKNNGMETTTFRKLFERLKVEAAEVGDGMAISSIAHPCYDELQEEPSEPCDDAVEEPEREGWLPGSKEIGMKVFVYEMHLDKISPHDKRLIPPPR